MDTGFTQEKLFVCLGPSSCFSFLVNPFPPSSPSLSPFLSIFLAPLAQRGTTVCRERSYPLDLAPELLIYFIFSSIFLLSAIFFLSPTPSLPLPFFFLSTKSFSSLIPYKHTNRISISQRKRMEKARE